MKTITKILLLSAFAIFTSCTKEEIEPIPRLDGENETGLSIVKTKGFEADYATFKLRKGEGPEKEYGQTLKRHAVTDLNPSDMVIYQLEVFSAGKPVNYSAFVENDEGEKKYISNTHLISINEGEIYYIYLENK